jgi:DNA-binding CsgD family transcriptional regulator
VLQQLVARANAFLVEEAAKPIVDTAPLREQIKVLEQEHARLVEAIATQAQANVQGVVSAIAVREKQMRELRGQIRELDRHDSPLPRAITMEGVQSAIEGLRTLLNQDPVQAAPLLRRLTGPMRVSRQDPQTKRALTWVVEFDADLASLFSIIREQPGGDSSQAQVTEGDIPDSSSSEQRDSWNRNPHRQAQSSPYKTPTPLIPEVRDLWKWRFEMKVRIVLKYETAMRFPNGRPSDKYRHIAQETQSLRSQGLSFKEIGKRLGVAGETAAKAWRQATGQPKGASQPYPKAGPLASRVREMMAEGLKVKQIAATLGIAEPTVRQAYRLATGGRSPADDVRRHAKYLRVASEVSQLVNSGLTYRQVANQLNIGVGTVSRAYRHATRDTLSPVPVRAKYFKFAPAARKLWIAGHPVYDIARRLGIDRFTVTRALRLAIPDFDSRLQRRQKAKFNALQTQVVELVQQRLTFREIGAKLGVCHETVRKAWRTARALAAASD